MSYRGPNFNRMQSQQGDIFNYVGQTATWRVYVSSTTGVRERGQGDTYYYAERTITGLFAGLGQDAPAFSEGALPAGMLTSGMMRAVTREELGRRDELRWRGNVYRVQSDPIPNFVSGLWETILKRGDT